MGPTEIDSRDLRSRTVPQTPGLSATRNIGNGDKSPARWNVLLCNGDGGCDWWAKMSVTVNWKGFGEKSSVVTSGVYDSTGESEVYGGAITWPGFEPDECDFPGTGGDDPDDGGPIEGGPCDPGNFPFIQELPPQFPAQPTQTGGTRKNSCRPTHASGSATATKGSFVTCHFNIRDAGICIPMMGWSPFGIINCVQNEASDWVNLYFKPLDRGLKSNTAVEVNSSCYNTGYLLIGWGGPGCVVDRVWKTPGA